MKSQMNMFLLVNFNILNEFLFLFKQKKLKTSGSCRMLTAAAAATVVVYEKLLNCVNIFYIVIVENCVTCHLNKYFKLTPDD